MSISHDPQFGFSDHARQTLAHELLHLRQHWWWLALFGTLLVVCGTIAIIYPAVATAYTIDVLAVLFLISGIATIISALWAGQWSGMLVQLLFGILYVAVGLIATERPLMTAATVTILVAASFIISGAFRALAALLIKFPQWGWSLLNGIVTMLAGVIIFRHLPLSGLWVLGLLVGLEMLLSGWTWLMIALAIRRLPHPTTTQQIV